jgi:DNA transposition AAA+ family ATPase
MTEPAAASDERPPRRLTPFLPTRQHRRFVEFADAVRRHRYIGACYGAPGIGKTLSARTYAAADDLDRWTEDRFKRSAVLPAALLASRTAMLTPGVTTTPRELETQIFNRCVGLGAEIARTLRPDISPELSRESPLGLELLIIDEADRLKTAGLELVRDYFDTSDDIGVVLIGMPGFERRLARYPQLYSRVGFAHHYRPLDSTDIPQVLAQYWQQLGKTYDPQRSTDSESIVTIIRITGGNFRLVERLMNQVARIMTISNLDTITPDAIEAAREVLVVGA